MTYTMTSFNTGQITLPKARRSKFKTKHFIGVETPEGLLIKPILDNQSDVVYYEDKQGFGIYCDSGMDPQTIISSIKSLHGQDN